MARSGFCRCGTLLRFEMTPLGYKTRCPSCKAIVRLRTDDAPKARRDARKPPADIPPLPSTLADFHVPAPPAIPADTEPVDLAALSTHDSNAPIALVDLPAYHPTPPPPEPGGAGWWLLALAVGAVVLAVGTAAIFLS